MPYNKDLPTAENLRYGDAVPKDEADTRYGYEIYPWWNNLNDRVSYDRMFAEGNHTRMLEAQAMISQSPLTSRDEIRDNMTHAVVPSRYGYPVRELTINDVLNQQFSHSEARYESSLWNDFSDSDGEINATQRPAGTVW